MGGELFGLGATDDGLQLFERGFLHARRAAEMAEQLLRGALADAGHVQQRGLALTRAAAAAMEGDSKAMRFVADELDELENGRMAVELNRVLFLAEDVEDFLAFGDGGQGLIDDAERFEGLGCGVELADAAVDQDQAGQGFVLVAQAAIAAGDGLVNAGEIVVAGNVADDEFAVLALAQLAVFPHHHGSHFIRALNVRDVEAFDAAGLFREIEG